MNDEKVDDTPAGLGVAVLILFIAIGLETTSTEILTPVDYERSEKLCESNGGIKELEFNQISLAITCVNNAVFTTTAGVMSVAWPAQENPKAN